MCAATQKAGHMSAPDQSLLKRHFSLATREPSTHEQMCLPGTRKSVYPLRQKQLSH